MSPDAVGRPFRIGLNLPYVERQMDGATPRWRDMLAMAQAAEAIGMDAVALGPRAVRDAGRRSCAGPRPRPGW